MWPCAGRQLASFGLVIQKEFGESIMRKVVCRWTCQSMKDGEDILLVIHGRPTLSILPRIQTEIPSTFHTCRNQLGSRMFRKLLQRSLLSVILQTKMDLNDTVPFAFGFSNR